MQWSVMTASSLRLRDGDGVGKAIRQAQDVREAEGHGTRAVHRTR
jgi:hypothetical protein